MSCFALQAVTAREIVATGGTAAMHCSMWKLQRHYVTRFGKTRINVLRVKFHYYFATIVIQVYFWSSFFTLEMHQ
jgi:hypothetical protein